MIGTKAVMRKRTSFHNSQNETTELFFLTSPASKVSRTTFLGDVATEVVGQDHQEPLGSQLVAPLPRPENHFKHNFKDLVELRITFHR